MRLIAVLGQNKSLLVYPRCVTGAELICFKKKKKNHWVTYLRLGMGRAKINVHPWNKTNTKRKKKKKQKRSEWSECFLLQICNELLL